MHLSVHLSIYLYMLHTYTHTHTLTHTHLGHDIDLGSKVLEIFSCKPCETVREREAGGCKGAEESECVCACLCVCMCLWERNQTQGFRRGRERGGERIERDGGMEGGGDLMCERRGGGYAIFKCPYTKLLYMYVCVYMYIYHKKQQFVGCVSERTARDMHQSCSM